MTPGRRGRQKSLQTRLSRPAYSVSPRVSDIALHSQEGTEKEEEEAQENARSLSNGSRIPKLMGAYLPAFGAFRGTCVYSVCRLPTYVPRDIARQEVPRRACIYTTYMACCRRAAPRVGKELSTVTPGGPGPGGQMQSVLQRHRSLGSSAAHLLLVRSSSGGRTGRQDCQDCQDCWALLSPPEPAHPDLMTGWVGMTVFFVRISLRLPSLAQANTQTQPPNNHHLDHITSILASV
jgi:hypothetical protein